MIVSVVQRGHAVGRCSNARSTSDCEPKALAHCSGLGAEREIAVVAAARQAERDQRVRAGRARCSSAGRARARARRATAAGAPPRACRAGAPRARRRAPGGVRIRIGLTWRCAALTCDIVPEVECAFNGLNGDGVTRAPVFTGSARTRSTASQAPPRAVHRDTGESNGQFRPRAGRATQRRRSATGSTARSRAGGRKPLRRRSSIRRPAQVARRVALASPAEVDAAVRSAAAAFPGWAATPPLRRARVMFKFKELVEGMPDELAALITAEHGKVLSRRDRRGDARARGGRVRLRHPAAAEGRVQRAGRHRHRHVLDPPAARACASASRRSTSR